MTRSIVAIAAVLLAAPALAQDGAPADAPTLPTCSAKITDGCVQSAAAEKRALTAEQAARRDARAGAWAPDGAAQPARAAAAPR